MSTLPLQGKRAVVSGSTQGIGWAAAERLAALGAQCFLLARNESKLIEAVAQLPHSELKHSYLVADFLQPAQVAAAISKFLSDYGGAHILVNNTGGPPAGPIKDATPEQFLTAFNQHLICNHVLLQALVPFMKNEGYGRVINVISTSVKIPLKGLGVSNTIRAGVAAWAKTWSNEIAPFGITVNNVLPGATATGRLQNIIDNKALKTGMNETEVTEEMLAEIPAQRFGQPVEIGAVIAFLAMPEAAYVNGVSIPVDGGRTGNFA